MRVLAIVALVACRPPSPVAGELVATLDQISLLRAEIRKARPPKQWHLAVFVNKDHLVAAEERPVLSGRFTIVEVSGRKLVMQSRLDADPAQQLVVTVEVTGEVMDGRSNDPVTGLESHGGEYGKVKVTVERDAKAAASEAARLRVASLWDLIGEHIDVPYRPAIYDAAVLGAQLVKTPMPANFEMPGQGNWVLLKTAQPDELYLAFDVEAGLIEFFPKTPMEPTAAARALFRAL
jgi:hypothetical protein